MKNVTLVIKKVDEKIIREFKAEAARKGLSLSKAFEEAVRTWLTFKGKYAVSETDLNNMAYEAIEDKFKDQSGKYVVIARGTLVGVFKSLEEVAEAMKKFDPPVKQALVVKVGYDDKVPGELEWLGGSIELKSA
ncbi:MAG: ribbon-helix-helix protein, CopG family [Thaumarchaeota archaeon]|nr:ribbon-helix-helix protein, CopG family [Nitrososphaerota archaeon]